MMFHCQAERWQARLEGTGQAIQLASHASDGRPNLYDAQSAHWETISAEEEQQLQHLVVTATQALSVNIEQVLTTLHIPPLSCRLQPATNKQICDTPLIDPQNKM